MTHLQGIFEKHGTDKGLPHEYGPFYQRHFEEIRNDHISLLEIGIFEGKSIEAWRVYFPNAQITGVDISPIRKPVLKGVTNITADVNEWMPDKPYDIIIDDGSHQAGDIQTALSRLWPFVIPNGWYVVEDWATQYNERFGGDATGSEATRFLYKIIDRLLQRQGPVAECHIYPELTFLRKLPLMVTPKNEPEVEVDKSEVLKPAKARDAGRKKVASVRA